MNSLNFFPEYKSRKKQIDSFNCGNRWTKRGIAILPLKYHLEYFNQQAALVSIYSRDGSVAISHGGIEMGQGINTKVAQVAAYVLGVPMEKISIKPTNNHTSPNVNVTGGSIASETCCMVNLQFCIDHGFSHGTINLNCRRLKLLARTF